MPITAMRTVPCGTSMATFTATCPSKRSRYSLMVFQFQSTSGGSPFQPASCERSCAAVAGVSGASPSPSCPMTSVVTPWRVLHSCNGFTSGCKSECVWKSMKPGVTKRPSALIVRLAPAPFNGPTATMRSPCTATSARCHGLPAPSINLPPVIIRSYITRPRPTCPSPTMRTPPGWPLGPPGRLRPSRSAGDFRALR